MTTDGAIIFRSGDKLYIVDGRPPATTHSHFFFHVVVGRPKLSLCD